MQAAINALSMTMVQQPGKEKLLISFKKPIAFTQQIFVLGTFLHRRNIFIITQTRALS